jgi:hypothetical protein
MLLCLFGQAGVCAKRKSVESALHLLRAFDTPTGRSVGVVSSWCCSMEILCNSLMVQKVCALGAHDSMLFLFGVMLVILGSWCH